MIVRVGHPLAPWLRVLDATGSEVRRCVSYDTESHEATALRTDSEGRISLEGGRVGYRTVSGCRAELKPGTPPARVAEAQREGLA